MRVERTAIDGLLVLEPRVFGDARGWFMESFSERTFRDATGVDVRFVQDNQSRSTKAVLRGLHFQLEPHAQGKLVRCVQGRVYDVAVDVRRGSASFGRWVGVELSEANKLQFWIPAGFAHGFMALSDTADFAYKTTDYYAPAAERAIRWNDPAIGIAWPDVGAPPVVSDKDAAAPLLAEVVVP